MRSRLRFVRAAGVANVVSLALVLGSCSSSSPHADTSPLSTTASAPPLYRGFVSKQSTQTALGTDKLLASGSPVDATGQERNLDGGRFVQADRTVNNSKGIALQVQVMPVTYRPDVVQNLVNGVAAGNGTYHFPASYGVGYAGRDYPGAKGKDLQGATSAVLRGNWYVAVGIDAPGEGRDAVADSVAITRQVVAFLRLPATHAKLYPTPSPSGS
jgi:hypothetical protein